jgi:hypothetical protein
VREALRVHIGRLVLDGALARGTEVGVLKAQLQAAIARGGASAPQDSGAPLTEHIRAAVLAQLDRSLGTARRAGSNARA